MKHHTTTGDKKVKKSNRHNVQRKNPSDRKPITKKEVVEEDPDAPNPVWNPSALYF